MTIYEFSGDEDRAILVDAFKEGQNEGLVNALTRMKSVGRIAITGTVGYDLSYIRLVPTKPAARFASSQTANSDSVNTFTTLKA